MVSPLAVTEALPQVRGLGVAGVLGHRFWLRGREPDGAGQVNWVSSE